jgi:hypothetical protein
MSEESHSAIDSTHASPNRTLIMHVPKLQTRPVLGIEDKQKPQPAWIPMKTSMQKYCEPYFTAVERWRNSRDEQIMINRLTLLDIADQILIDYSQLTTTYFFDLVFENKNVDLLEEVQPSAGKFFIYNGDVTAFSNSKSLVPADMFNRIGLFFQSNLLRNISGRNESYLLSSNLETRKNVISVIEKIFRLPEEAGLVHFVYAEGSPHNWRTLERNPLSPNAENFISFMLDKRDDAKQQSAMDLSNNEGKEDESLNKNKNKKTVSKSSKASSPTKRSVQQEKIPAVVHLLQKKQQPGNGEGNRQSQQKGRIVSSDSENEQEQDDEEDEDEEQEEVIFEKRKNTKGTKAGTTTVSGDIWKHFFLHSPEGSGSSKIQFAECNHCGIHIRYLAQTGTIPFHTHIEVCPDFDPCRPSVAASSAPKKKRKSTDSSSVANGPVCIGKDKNGRLIYSAKKHGPVLSALPQKSATTKTNTTTTSTSSTSRQATNASNKAASTTSAKKTPATTAAVKKALELSAREKKKFMGTKVAKYLLITFHHSNSSLLKKQAAGLPYSDVQNKELKLFMGEVVDVIPATSQYAKDRKYVIHWLDCNEENEIMDEKDYQDGVDLYESHFLWTTTHKCMGTKVAAYFFIPGIFTREGEETADGAEKLFIGKVTKYCPASGARAKDQLYHINWADGDEQDMDETEFVKGKELYNLLHPEEAEGNTGKGERGEEEAVAVAAPGSESKKNTKVKEEKEKENNKNNHSSSISSSALKKKKRTIDEVVKEEEENNSYSSDEEGEEKMKGSKTIKEEKEEGVIQVKKEPRLEDNHDKKVVDESEAMEVENQPLEQSEANPEEKPTQANIPVKKEIKKNNKNEEEDEEAEDENNDNEAEDEEEEVEEEDPFASPAWTTDHISIHTKVTKVLRKASTPRPAPKRGKSNRNNSGGGVMKPMFFTHAAYAHGVVLKYNLETKEYWVIWERLRRQEILSEQEYKDGVELSNELLLKEMQSSGKWVLRSLECDDNNNNNNNDHKTTTTNNSKNNNNKSSSNNKNNKVVKTEPTKQEATTKATSSPSSAATTSALPVPITSTNTNNNNSNNNNENDSSSLTIRFARSPQPTTPIPAPVASSTGVNDENMVEVDEEEVEKQNHEKPQETEATISTVTHAREAVPTEIVSPTTDVAHSLLNLATSSTSAAADNQQPCFSSSALGEEDLVLPEPDMNSFTDSVAAAPKEVIEIATKIEKEESTEQTDMETQSQSFNVPVVTTVVALNISPPERPEQDKEPVMIQINTNSQQPQQLESEQRAERISEVVPSLPPPRARPAAAMTMGFSQQSTTSSHSSNVLSPMKERLLKAEEIETIIYIDDDSDEDENNNNNGVKKGKENEMEIIEEEEPTGTK